MKTFKRQAYLKAFADIAPGDVFSYEHSTYMKTQSVGGRHTDNGMFNAVRLADGANSGFPDFVSVLPLSVEIHVVEEAPPSCQ